MAPSRTCVLDECFPLPLWPHCRGLCAVQYCARAQRLATDSHDLSWLKILKRVSHHVCSDRRETAQFGVNSHQYCNLGNPLVFFEPILADPVLSFHDGQHPSFQIFFMNLPSITQHGFGADPHTRRKHQTFLSSSQPQMLSITVKAKDNTLFG